MTYQAARLQERIDELGADLAAAEERGRRLHAEVARLQRIEQAAREYFEAESAYIKGIGSSAEHPTAGHAVDLAKVNLRAALDAKPT